jgi:hypothetical protein
MPVIDGPTERQLAATDKPGHSVTLSKNEKLGLVTGGPVGVC